MGIWRGMIAGIVGGVMAAGAMSVVHKGLVEITREPTPVTDRQHDDDATVQVADVVTRRLLGRSLPDHKKPLAGNIVHYVFGASIGGLYGAVAAVAPRVTVAVGLPFGIAVWLGAHVVMVPALGFSAPPIRQPLSKEASEFTLHLVYGAVTELTRRLMCRLR